MSYFAVVVVVVLVIAIHEWGHLLAAKWCGIPIERFSIGFGPKLVGFRYRGTSYWLSLIPLGGYVLPALDESESRSLPLHKAILFALGGPFANIVLAYLGLVVVGRVQFSLSAFDTLSFAATRLWVDVQLLAQAILMLSSGVGEISGIVGIVAIGGSQFGATLAGLLAFSVAINLNLAMVNLLPFPPLDGGRIAFAVLEKIYQPLFRIRAPLTLAGWAFMLALMVYATIHDLGRIGLRVLS
jgi:membrane-associated protease RseP (regulator of RpoE activity)